jgi:organic radical activating enzyme
MNKNFTIEQGVFYITNVCNLACSYCETYNNRNFKGHFYWNDHRADHEEWSTKLDINFITIIGGEPFANPDLKNWIYGIKQYWPECKNFNVCTNGTYLKHNIEFAREIIDQNIWLDISIHDPSTYESIKDALEEIVSVFDYNISIENQKISYRIGTREIARLYSAYVFHKNSQRYIRNGITYMHRSIPEKSHELCIRNLGHCHFFVKGLLYKCYLTAVSKDLTNQFAFDNKSRELLESYQAASAFNSEEDLETFFKTLQNPIKQCTLCPETPSIKPIWPLNRKK